MSREAFEEKLAKDRYDWDTRKVYADWLEEQGLDSEAEFHRAWTPRWQQAEDFLKQFARNCGPRWKREATFMDHFDEEPERPECTIQDVAEAVKHYLETGEGDPGFGHMGFGACNQFIWERDSPDQRGITAREFWENYEIWSRTEVSEDKKEREPFDCCGGDNR